VGCGKALAVVIGWCYFVSVFLGLRPSVQAGCNMDGNMAVARAAYRLRKSTRYWHGRGDRTYTLSSDLRAWWEYPQPRRLPPLSGKERAAFEAVQERRRRVHPLDRAAALERRGPLPKSALVAPVAEKEKPQPKPKKRKGGRPPDFDHTAIKRFAKNIMRKKNKPDTMALLMEKVGDACDDARPCIKKPGPSQFKAIVGPIFRKHGHKSP
jgi:hypothetical protein